MRRALCASVLGVAISAGGCGGTEIQEDVAVRPTTLTIVVQPRGLEDPRRSAALQCDPPGERIAGPPQPGATLMGNQSALDPGSVASTEIFGGSERALVRVRITNPIFGEERKVNAS